MYKYEIYPLIGNTADFPEMKKPLSLLLYDLGCNVEIRHGEAVLRINIIDELPKYANEVFSALGLGIREM